MLASFTRRDFLKATSVTAAAVLETSLLGRGGVYAAAPYMRRNAAHLPAQNPILVSYKKAIKAMKALPQTNPLSWAYQAAIHGTALSGSFPAWGTCEHGTYFFFSWHRMYLWYFERIIRKMSGDAQWALPFWNYEPANARKLPLPFRSPANASNDLYTPNRGAGWNAGTSALSDSAVASSAGFALVPFDDFSNSIEGTPHAAIHVSILGWMGSVSRAAQDPIFWLHHCNIDRLWNLWLAQGGSRTDPLTDATWTGTPFTFFDENGTQVQLTGCDILRAQEQLDYVYQGEPPQVKLYCKAIVKPPKWKKEVVFRFPQPPVLPPGPDPVAVEIDVREIRPRLLALTREAGVDLTLDLEGVEADQEPDVYYEVYVGVPRGQTPRFRSAHYVGNLALFGAGVRDQHQHRDFKPATFSFRIDEAMQAALSRPGAGGDQLAILFVPRGPDRDGKPEAVRASATIKIGSASIAARRRQEE
jgi:hypothetical protein